MTMLVRQPGVLGAALVFLAGLNAGGRLPVPAMAQPSSSVIWHIHSEVNRRSSSSSKSGDLETISQVTESHSSDGQTVVNNATRQVNPDGSSHEHTVLQFDDGKGNTASYVGDDDLDSNGIRKVHGEDTSRESGKCEVVITDDEYDKNGVVTSTSKRVTPCEQGFRVDQEAPGEGGQLSGWICSTKRSFAIQYEAPGGIMSGTFTFTPAAGSSGDAGGTWTYKGTAAAGVVTNTGHGGFRIEKEGVTAIAIAMDGGVMTIATPVSSATHSGTPQRIRLQPAADACRH